MSKQQKIVVRGEARSDIDPAVFVQLLLAIAVEWEQPAAPTDSPDVFQAAIEDHAASPQEETG